MSVVRVLKRVLPSGVLKRLRAGHNSLAAYRDHLFSVDATVLLAALRRLGVEQGRIIFVHSAFDQMRSIRATPVEIITTLQAAVGEGGTLAMPSFSMVGSSKVYLESHSTFDWRRTPSGSGMLTEVFRRMSGTERSLHPTHSVVSRGRDAAWLVEGHERSTLPFDEHSPFEKMLDRNALVVRLGKFDAMTFRHLADHHHQSLIRHPVYGEREMVVRVTDRAKQEHIVRTRAHNPRISCDYTPVLAALVRAGRLLRTRVGRVHVSLFPVRDYMDAYARELAAGHIKHVLGASPSDEAPRG